MNVTKTNPAGINWYVQKLQTKLHDTLIGPNYWNLTDAAQYKSYGLCYRNKTDDGYVAENYEADGEYREVYWSDELAAISFFGISNNIKNGEADIHLVFFANLQKLNLTDSAGLPVGHRADEELRIQVQKIIGLHSYGFNYISTELWLENVLREYPGSRRDNRLKTVDMHPIHCFRINLKLMFNPNKIC